MSRHDYRAFNRKKSFGAMIDQTAKGTGAVKRGAVKIEWVLAKKRPGLAGKSFLDLTK